MARRNTDMYKISSGYLDQGLEKKAIKKCVQNLIACIKASGIDFDAIAFSGYSGALFAPIIAYRLNKHVIIVRKDAEESHSSMCVEGFIPQGVRYIIIDDFISTGLTIQNMYEKIKNERVYPPLLQAIFLWHSESRGRLMNKAKMKDKCEYPVFHAENFTEIKIKTEINSKMEQGIKRGRIKV